MPQPHSPAGRGESFWKAPVAGRRRDPHAAGRGRTARGGGGVHKDPILLPPHPSPPASRHFPRRLPGSALAAPPSKASLCPLVLAGLRLHNRLQPLRPGAVGAASCTPPPPPPASHSRCPRWGQAARRGLGQDAGPRPGRRGARGRSSKPLLWQGSWGHLRHVVSAGQHCPQDGDGRTAARVWLVGASPAPGRWPSLSVVSMSQSATRGHTRAGRSSGMTLRPFQTAKPPRSAWEPRPE